MASWKVSKEIIEVFDHPNAEKLQLGKVGTYQVVVQKGLYNGGEAVVFAPEKSILTGILEQEWKTYLAGPDKNMVKSVTLRGELSCGIIIPNEIVKQVTGKDISELPVGEDLSSIMGITKYVPAVPKELEGDVIPIPDNASEFKTKHDVEQFGIFASEFVPGERVIITEKIHGVQGVYYAKFMPDGQIIKWVSSKGLCSDDLCFVEDKSNGYWRAAENIDLWNILKNNYGVQWKEETVVQVFGEVVPTQGGNWNYGKKNPTLIIFKIIVNGVVLPFDIVSPELRENWVPVVYDGLYENVQELRKLCEGNEMVSGEQLHIKEGVVISPYIERKAKGTRLFVKVINPKYKETGEELS